MNSFDILFDNRDMLNSLEDYNNNVSLNGFYIKDQTKYTKDCYNVLNDLCALGNVQKMYIPQLIDENETLIGNQNLYEIQLSKNLNVAKNGTILELGCGCGRITDHISKLTNCIIYGINIDNKQLNNARDFAKRTSNTNVIFKYGDLNSRIDFNDNIFDAVNEVGAGTYSNNLAELFKEIYRVLKPGGRFVMNDCVLLDNFDKNNIAHMKLVNNVRMVGEIGGMWYYKYWEEAAVEAKFKIILSKGGNSLNDVAELPMLKKEHKHFDKIESIIWFLTKIYILPFYMIDIIKRMRRGAEELIEAEEMKLLTLTWDFIFEK